MNEDDKASKHLTTTKWGKMFAKMLSWGTKKPHRCSLENVAEPNLWNIAQTFASIFHKGSHRCYLSPRPHTFIEFSLQLEAITGRAGRKEGWGQEKTEGTERWIGVHRWCLVSLAGAPRSLKSFKNRAALKTDTQSLARTTKPEA